MTYPITLSMIGGTSSFFRRNKTFTCELTESHMRKTHKSPRTYNKLFIKIFICENNRSQGKVAAFINFIDSQYNPESVNANHHSMYSDQR